MFSLRFPGSVVYLILHGVIRKGIIRKFQVIATKGNKSFKKVTKRWNSLGYPIETGYKIKILEGIVWVPSNKIFDTREELIIELSKY